MVLTRHYDLYQIALLIHHQLISPHPLNILVPLLLLICALQIFPQKISRKTASYLAAIPTLALSVFSLCYLFAPFLYDCIEPEVAAVSYKAFTQHISIYGQMDAAPKYAELYGPMTYLVHFPAFFLFGGSLASSKLMGILAFLASMVFIYRCCRTLVSSSQAVIATGFASLMLAQFSYQTFWNRPEPFLLLCVSLSLWLVLRKQSTRYAAAIAVGICCGIAINLKVTAVFYCVPVAALLYMKGGWRKVAVAMGSAISIGLVPFAYGPASFSEYVQILRIMSRHGISLVLLGENFETALLFGLPILALLVVCYKAGRLPSPHARVYLISVMFALIGICITGAKRGAGPHHLIPLVAVLPHAFLYLWTEVRDGYPTQAFRVIFSTWTCVLCLMSLMAFVEMSGDFLVGVKRGRPALSEIRSISADYPGRSIEMGYGEDIYDRFTFLRPQLVFAGNPYTIDAISVQESQFGGVSLPQATRSYIETCGTDIWLIPKGQPPFAVRNGYHSGWYVFDDAFRKTFVDHYQRLETRNYFEIWGCSSPR